MAEIIRGTVSNGLGQGADFTSLAWVKQQFVDTLGIDPWPGTLNLHLLEASDLEKWNELKSAKHYRIKAPDRGNCDALCFPVLLENRISGAIVLPVIDNYPVDKLEIISPLKLREELGLENGSITELVFSTPQDATTIIFDLDGTLLDTIEAFYILAKRTGEEFGLTMIREHVYELLNFGRPYWEKVLPDTEKDKQDTIEKLNKRAIQMWPEVMAEHASVFPSVKTTLEQLKDRGLKLAIVTGSGRTSLDLLVSAGLDEFFDVIISAEDVKKRKPDPEGLLLCLDKLGAKAETAIYVGDTTIDMQAARAAGLRSVAVLSGAGNSEVLCLAGAHRLVRDHSRLVDVFH